MNNFQLPIKIVIRTNFRLKILNMDTKEAENQLKMRATKCQENKIIREKTIKKM